MLGILSHKVLGFSKAYHLEKARKHNPPTATDQTPWHFDVNHVRSMSSYIMRYFNALVLGSVVPGLGCEAGGRRRRRRRSHGGEGGGLQR